MVDFYKHLLCPKKREGSVKVLFSKRGVIRQSHKSAQALEKLI